MLCPIHADRYRAPELLYGAREYDQGIDMCTMTSTSFSILFFFARFHSHRYHSAVSRGLHLYTTLSPQSPPPMHVCAGSRGLHHACVGTMTVTVR